MPANVGLKWAVGPKRSKAKQIPNEMWKRYESEIREMYTSMTLEELAAEMKRIHGFEATSRQYTSHLERWGLKKYNTKNTAPEIVAEGLGEGMNLEDSSTLVVEGPKRDRTASNIDDCDTEDPDDTASGTPCAKKTRMDDEQASLHQHQATTLDVNGTATIEHDGDISTSPTQDLSADLLHRRPELVLSESTVQSILTRLMFPYYNYSQRINVDLCLGIARSIQSLIQPHQGPELSSTTEHELRIIADYLFATERYAEATNIYLLVSESERSHKDYVNFFYTPSLISAARAARSKEDCIYIKKNLNALVDDRSVAMWSSLEQSLTYIILANLSSRLEPASETSFHHSVAGNLKYILESGRRHYVADSSLYLLGYVYHKWLHRLPFFALAADGSKIPAMQAEFSVSHGDFLRFYSTSCTDVQRQTKRIMLILERSFQWCLEVRSRLRPRRWTCPALGIVGTHDELGTFAELWTQWHGGYSQSLEPPQWTTQGRSTGISLAEHLRVCAKVMYDLFDGAYESNHAITLYLQTLYERIDPLEETLQLIETDLPVSGPALTTSMMASANSNAVMDRTTSPEFPHIVPTIAPSLESTNSSFGRLKQDSTAMAMRRQRGVSYKSGTVLSAPGMDYSLYGSNPSMSFLSEVFARSCSVSLSSQTQGSGMGKSSSQQTRTPVNDDGWTDLEVV